MGLGSMAARVGAVLAPWAAKIGNLLPVPEDIANDLPLALFGAVAVIAGTVALLVLPETKGKRCPETIVDAVLELQSAKQSALPTQIATGLAAMISIGVSVLVGVVVQSASESVIGAVGAGVGTAVAALSGLGACYKFFGPKRS